MKTIFLRIGKFVFAVGLIFLLFKKGLLDFSVLKLLLNPVVMMCGMTIIGISLTLQSRRWVLLLRSRNLKVSFWEAWRLFLIGVFFNHALPGSVSGDIVRGFYILQDYPERKGDAALSVVMDRLLGLYSMVTIGTGGVLLGWTRVAGHPQLMALATAVIGLFAFMTSIFVLSFSQRWSQFFRIDKLLAKISVNKSISISKAQLLSAFALSVLAQGLSILFMVLIGHAIGETTVDLQTYFFAVPIGFIIAAVPIAPAGIGVGQVAFLYLFQTFSGQQSLVGQTAITAFQLTLLIWGLLGAIFYVQRKSTKTIPSGAIT